VVPVTSGSKTLKDALNEAMRDWVTNVRDTFYIIGTVAGPHPYPTLVRDFNAVVGREAARRCSTDTGGCRTRSSPASAAARTRSGCSMRSSTTRASRSWRRGRGTRHRDGEHAASLVAGAPACCTATARYVLCDDDGQITETHSVSAGSTTRRRPEHAWLKDTGRAQYVGITDDEALAAFHELALTEGIIPRSSRRTPWRTASSSRASTPRTGSCW
jgi:tryptophan synthase beta chain